jgi:hypothetical protein
VLKTGCIAQSAKEMQVHFRVPKRHTLLNKWVANAIHKLPLRGNLKRKNRVHCPVRNVDVGVHTTSYMPNICIDQKKGLLQTYAGTA